MTTGMKGIIAAAVFAVTLGLVGVLVHSSRYGDPAANADAVQRADQALTRSAVESAAAAPRMPGDGARPDNLRDKGSLPPAEGDEPTQRPDSSNTANVAEPEPQGPHAISGLVVDEAGRGVGGIEVVSHLTDAFDSEGSSNGPGPDRGRAVLTDIDGYYEIAGVADGEYRIRTTPTERYETASTKVRAGSVTADLILRARRPTLEIGGTVRADGDPLSGAEVVAVGQPAGAAYTGEDGSYEIELQISGGKSNYTLRFARDGYREKRSVLTSDDLAATGRIRVDADLEPRQALVEVTGSVRDRDGEPVAGESVQLYSEAARQRYTAVSGRRGEIRFPEVETSEDYSVSVRPHDLYRDYVVRDVEIGVAGADLEVVLEPRNYGRLAGQMVDPDGQPVPGFSLWLRNTGAVNQPARLVTGDQQGFFEVDRVEAGALVFETRGSPLVSITGLQLSPGETKQVTLVLDWGSHQVAGLVMDDRGRPLPASELFVTSVRRDSGLRAHAVRRAVTDETGYFLVNGVGSGYHTVRVGAPGFRATVLDHQVGADNPEVIIRLERAYSNGM